MDAVAEANGTTEIEEPQKTARKTGRYKKVCTTDPDATMATNGRNRRLEPSYKQHGAVDDVFDVILDVEVTTGEVNEGQVILERIDAVEATTGRKSKDRDGGCGLRLRQRFGGLESRNIGAVIPVKAEPIRSPVPLRRFRYDAKYDIIKCPRGKALRPTRPVTHGRFFYSKAKNSSRCDLASVCLSKGRSNKAGI